MSLENYLAYNREFTKQPPANKPEHFTGQNDRSVFAKPAHKPKKMDTIDWDKHTFFRRQP